MYEHLINYIRNNSSTPLTANDVKTIEKIFIHRKLRKRQYFLQNGEVCKNMGFIVKGAMRQYSVDDKGVEHTIRLAIENWWVGDRESHIMLTPSVYNIDVCEDTTILQVTRADTLSLSNSIPALAEMGRRLDENSIIASQKRLNAHISLSAEKRYAAFAKLYPEFLQRFPQHIIASYLGITKETLSRIRNQALKK